MPRAALFAYVANNGAGTASAFRMDAATGALTLLAPTAIASDTNPYSVTIDAAGRRLYVAHGDASSVVTFSIDPTSGELRPAPISRNATGAYPVSAAIDPSGRFLYVSTMVADAVAAYVINPTTAALTPVTGSPFAAGKLLSVTRSIRTADSSTLPILPAAPSLRLRSIASRVH